MKKCWSLIDAKVGTIAKALHIKVANVFGLQY